MKDAQLHLRHVAERQRTTEAALAAANFDGLVIQSGAPFTYFVDDQDAPLRTTPHFAHWCPLEGPFHLLYIRPGAIVPISPVMQYVDEKPLDTLTLLINLDASGKATGTLYEDAGDGWSYKQGDYLLTTYAAEKKGNEITVTVSKSEGKRERPSRKVVVQIAGTTTTATGTDGQPIKITTK